MSADRERDRLDRVLPYLGAALAYVVGAVHLLHPDRGLRRLVLLLVTGNADLLAYDPRPLVFTLVGIAFLLGPQTALFDRYRRPVLLGGIALTATFLVGYFGWHLTGHGGFLPGRRLQLHDQAVVQSMVEHLRIDPIARISKLAEAALLVVLVVLYRRDWAGARTAE